MNVRSLVTGAIALGALTMASTASAEPVRILVAAGNKLGLPAERPLKFADDDARRVRDVLVSLGGVRNEHAIFLSEPDRGALFAAIDRAKAEAQRHRPEEVTLVFYFSGHGDRDALHLGTDRVLVTDLSSKLAEVPAGLRIAVTDACRATREKGFAADEPFAISTTMVPQASGQVWLHASSDGEAAQESDDLQGAIFTQAWLSGLRGAADANGDARVTLDESFAFAHSQTLIRSSKSSGVLQKPEAVVSLREAGPVVITQTATHLATLALPQAKDTHFLVYSAGAKSVLSELWGSPDRRLLLRLPAGRYVVQRRFGSVGGVAQIAVGQGEERSLRDSDFTTGTLEAVAGKGIDPDRIEPPPTTPEKHHELSAGYDAGFNVRTGFVHGPRATYAYAWRRMAISLGGGADFTSRALAGADETLSSTYGRLGVELRLPTGPLVFRGGVGGRAGVVFQSVQKTQAVMGNATADSKSAFALGPEVFLAARMNLSRAWFADLSATGAMTFLRQDGAATGITTTTGALALGARF